MAVGVTEKKNRQFFMVGTNIDHSNDIKSSKLRCFEHSQKLRTIRDFKICTCNERLTIVNLLEQSILNAS